MNKDKDKDRDRDKREREEEEELKEKRIKRISSVIRFVLFYFVNP